MIKCCCLAVLLAAALPALAQEADDAHSASGEYGAHPVLPEPDRSVLPTLHIAKARPWSGDAKPQSAPGTRVFAVARDLHHPRWVYVLPNGDILVAESDAPPKPLDAKGIKGKVHKWVMKRAGSGTYPSADQITLLRDLAGDGLRVERHVFLTGLHSPIGMALIGDQFYVADTDAVLAFPYHQGDTEIHSPPRTVTSLPAGQLNHHWTKSLVASADGTKLYVGVGSNSNAGENGTAAETDRAAVWEIDPKRGTHRIFASGLRNPVGLAWEPGTGALWVSVNERDELGDHMPPDYMTPLREGAFYGFPFSYYGNHLDPRVKSQRPELVAQALTPAYALGAHTASLGLCWSGATTLPAPFHDGMFVGQHGSWNRRTYNGYKVVFVAFKNGSAEGLPIDVLTHFVDSKKIAHGRPVGLAIDKQGSLLVADDVGNTLWRVARE